MKQFDMSYTLLEEMLSDDYYPPFLVEKIKQLFTPVISLLENGETNKDIIQGQLDTMTMAINDLQNNSDILFIKCRCYFLPQNALPRALPSRTITA